MLVVLPATRLDGEAVTTNCVAAAGTTEIVFEVALATVEVVESWAVIVWAPAVSSVAVAVATPEALKADSDEIEPPPRATESVNATVSVKLVIGLPKESST